MEEGMSCRVKEVRGVAVNGVEGREANAKQGGSVELVQVWRATKDGNRRGMQGWRLTNDDICA